MIGANPTLTVEQRIHKTHVDLMRHPTWCRYSGLFLIGKLQVLDGGGTAGTDGVNVLYFREFCATLREEELRFLILHENLHKALRHLTTWQSLYEQDRRLANMACDYVINLMLVDGDKASGYLKMPECGLLDPQYRGMSAGEVFRRLREKQSAGGGQGANDPQQGKASGRARSKADKSAKGDPEGASEPGPLDEHDWEGAREMDAATRAETAEQIAEALRYGGRLADRLGGERDRTIEDLLTPKVDWREVLREFVQSVCAGKTRSTWRRPNRRLVGQGVYLPSLVGETMGKLVVAVDTSGSIQGQALTSFLTEVVSLATLVAPEAIELLYWDARVAAHERYTRDTDDYALLAATTRPKGGGGTVPGCIPAHLKAVGLTDIECVVVLTDGYVSGWGDWDAISAPVLWVITHNPEALAPVGKTVHMQEGS